MKTLYKLNELQSEITDRDDYSLMVSFPGKEEIRVQNTYDIMSKMPDFRNDDLDYYLDYAANDQEKVIHIKIIPMVESA